MPLPDASLNPGRILRDAIRAVPAVKFALGVAGVAAALALIAAMFSGQTVPALIGTVAMLALMTLLVVFARLVKVSPASLTPLALVFAWAVLILTVSSAALFVLSVFFDWPKPPDLLLRAWSDRNVDQLQNPGRGTSSPSPPIIVSNPKAGGSVSPAGADNPFTGIGSSTFSGHAIVYEGNTDYGRSGFAFAKQSLVAWDSGHAEQSRPEISSASLKNLSASARS